jgi:hypothetical protein
MGFFSSVKLKIYITINIVKISIAKSKPKQLTYTEELVLTAMHYFRSVMRSQRGNFKGEELTYNLIKLHTDNIQSMADPKDS